MLLLLLLLVTHCVSVGVGGGGGGGGTRGRTRSYIQLKDYEFSGEDQVLQKEINRRMGGGRLKLPPLDLEDPRTQKRARRLYAMRAVAPEDVVRIMQAPRAANATPARRGAPGPRAANATPARRGAPGPRAANATPARRRAAGRRPSRLRTSHARTQYRPILRTHKEENRSYRAYIYSPNAKMSMALSLQLMEQAIYTVQYKFKEVEKYTKRYTSDYAFRISFIMKQLRDWVYEMRVWHKWLTNPHWQSWNNHSILLNIIYYQYMVRNHVDITQSVYYVINLQEEVVKKTAELPDTDQTENAYKDGLPAKKT